MFIKGSLDNSYYPELGRCDFFLPNLGGGGYKQTYTNVIATLNFPSQKIDERV